MKRKDFIKSLVGLPLLPVVLGEVVESEPKDKIIFKKGEDYTLWAKCSFKHSDSWSRSNIHNGGFSCRHEFIY